MPHILPNAFSFLLYLICCLMGCHGNLHLLERSHNPSTPRIAADGTSMHDPTGMLNIKRCAMTRDRSG